MFELGGGRGIHQYGGLSRLFSPHRVNKATRKFGLGGVHFSAAKPLELNCLSRFLLSGQAISERKAAAPVSVL